MASEDIAPKLIAGVRKEFQRNCLKDVEMRKLSEKVGNGEATYEDAAYSALCSLDSVT